MKNQAGPALSKVWEFERNHRAWHTSGTPFLINTSRLVEFDADPEIIQVFVHEGGDWNEKVFLEVDHFLDAVGTGKTINHYQVDDRNGGVLDRKIEIRRNGGWVILFAAEKDGNKWRALGGSTRPGCALTDSEFETLIEYARVQNELRIAYANDRASHS